MSFLQFIFGHPAPSRGNLGFPETRRFDGKRYVPVSWLEDPDPERETLVTTAVEFWRDQLTKLADAHAAQLQVSIGQMTTKTPAEMKDAAKQADKKIKAAHQLLLQQSDARWGRSVTDTALYRLNRCSMSFRMDAES